MNSLPASDEETMESNVALLEGRLIRERAARKAGEALLSSKSRE